MIDYSTIANTSGSFPSVIAADASGGGATDGTPYLATVLDDLWGFNQHLLSVAGMTPDGVTESSTASQKMEALQRVCGHPGEIVPWAGPIATDPNTVNVRLLPCEGQTVSASLYANLVAATYVGDANNTAAHTAGGGFVKTSDAGGVTPSTSGAYFKLPELRGLFLRSLDTTGSFDPDGATRYIGEAQADDVEEHSHYIDDTTGVLGLPGLTTGQYWLYVTDPGAGVRTHLDTGIFNSAAGAGSSKATALVSTGDDETRPINAAFKMCVRY